MNALLVVAREPIPGKTKTRLSPPLTPDEAAQLYEMFLLDTLEIMRQVEDVHRFIVYLPLEANGYFRKLAPDFQLLPQKGSNLGARLDNSLKQCLNSEYDHAVIMDSDSPSLPAEYVQQAFSELKASDGVIGPCDDGGYYLIGLNRPAPSLLREVQMSTNNVTQDTLVLAQKEGLRMAQLPMWYDVDNGKELSRLHHDMRSLPSACAPHTRAFLAELWPDLKNHSRGGHPIQS
jgi:rSAM/selenodomain-associated transferase 1